MKLDKRWVTVVDDDPQTLIEIMNSLHNKLQEADQLIKYSWED